MKQRYQNPELDIDTRVSDLLARMSLEEKIAQMHAYWLILQPDGDIRQRADVSDEFAGSQATRAIADKLSDGVGQITRPLGTQRIDPQTGVRALNALQRRIITQGRWGIPAMFHEECLVGLMCQGATLFPSALNLAASWHPELVQQVAKAIREEARSVGCHHGLAPVLDVSRDVRWGRTEETFGEDPWLCGIMATRFVRGLQGEKRDFLATLKHFVGHSFSEGGRNHAPVHLGWRELNDIFLLPFEMAVKLADAGSVMPAYHDIDNQPCHNDALLLTEVLRRRWGFDGLIVADYSGVSLLHQHHRVTRDHAESAAAAFNAGLDIELPKDDCSRHLLAALEQGLITEAKIDEIVYRILKEKMRLGLFEAPYVAETALNLRGERALSLAYQSALESIVLLENRDVLPLNPATPQKIAVIGPTADDPLALLCGYSFPVHLILNEEQSDASHIVTPLAALKRAFPHATIQYQQGCAILEQRLPGAPVFPGDVGKPLQQSPVSTDTRHLAAAAGAAQDSDIAIVFVGDLAGLFQCGTVGEGSDTDSLSLPGVQQSLLEAVVATGTPTIVVMTGGRPYQLNGLEDKVSALLMAFAPGEQGGTAIADVLRGQHSPCGKLVVSVPRSAGAMPYYYNHKLKSGGTPIAFHFGCRYPFGYGLSYSRFSYRHLTCPRAPVPIDGEIAFSFELANSGPAAATEVAQVYVYDKVASLVRPLQELKAFQRVTLSPGERVTLHFTLPVDMLNFTGADGSRQVEGGEFELQIGASSQDIRLRQSVWVQEEVRRLPTQWRMESHARIQRHR